MPERGSSARTFPDGAEAVVLLELSDSVRLLHELRAVHPEIPVIVLSASSTEGHRRPQGRRRLRGQAAAQLGGASILTRRATGDAASGHRASSRPEGNTDSGKKSVDYQLPSQGIDFRELERGADSSAASRFRKSDARGHVARLDSRSGALPNGKIRNDEPRHGSPGCRGGVSASGRIHSSRYDAVMTRRRGAHCLAASSFLTAKYGVDSAWFLRAAAVLRECRDTRRSHGAQPSCSRCIEESMPTRTTERTPARGSGRTNSAENTERAARSVLALARAAKSPKQRLPEAAASQQ